MALNQPWLLLGGQRSKKRVRLETMANADKERSSSFPQSIVPRSPSVAHAHFPWLGARDES